MTKLCVNVVLVDDWEGCQHADILLAHAPCEDGVVDASSEALTHAIVFHDDCLGTVHACVLWTNQAYIVRTGVLSAVEAMVQLLDQQLNG
jgi:hypothetical protein